MENAILREHRARITKNHIRRTANLIKLQRFAEAREDSIRFSSILLLWEIQNQNIQEAAMKGARK